MSKGIVQGKGSGRGAEREGKRVKGMRPEDECPVSPAINSLTQGVCQSPGSRVSLQFLVHEFRCEHSTLVLELEATTAKTDPRAAVLTWAVSPVIHADSLCSSSFPSSVRYLMVHVLPRSPVRPSPVGCLCPRPSAWICKVCGFVSEQVQIRQAFPPAMASVCLYSGAMTPASEGDIRMK